MYLPISNGWKQKILLQLHKYQTSDYEYNA